jgi:Mor family transcriptional regulator
MDNHNTAARSLLVPMMRMSMQQLINMAMEAGLYQDPRYQPIIGHAVGVLNEIDFSMEEAPAFIPHEEIGAMYKSGMSMLDVATQARCSLTHVQSVMKRLGIKPRPQGPRTGTRHPAHDPERVQKMVVLHDQGQTLEEIAQQFRITRERVRQILIAAGVDTSQRPLTERELAAVQEYVDGSSIIQVAERYGVGIHTMKNLILRAGEKVHPVLKRRERMPKTMRDAKIAAELYRKGKTVKEIAAAIGRQDRSGGTVYRLLAIAGVRPTRRGEMNKELG